MTLRVSNLYSGPRPNSIVSGPGVERNGASPTVLNGYGGFNISRGPAFTRSIFWWIEQGGVYVNNKPVGIDHKVTAADRLTETMLILRAGKKNHRLLRFV